MWLLWTVVSKETRSAVHTAIGWFCDPNVPIVVNQEMGLRGGFTISSLQMSLEIPSSNALANSMENTMYSKSVPSSTGKNPRGL